MSDGREGRMVAAGEEITVLEEIKGRKGKIELKENKYRLRPVVVKHLCDLENDALAFYKRQYLKTFTENADLLGNGKAGEVIQQEFTKAARWSVNDLPQKTVYDVSELPVTDKLKAWAKEEFDLELDTENALRALILVQLDNELITPQKVYELTGQKPRAGKVRYDEWWVRSSIEGMVSFIVSSLRRDYPDIDKDHVANWPYPKLVEASRIVERLTSASVGNI